MNRTQRIIQAYRNAPWRRQLQMIGLFSASVIFITVVAGVYLNVTARAATIGREIQQIQRDMVLIEREIEHLTAELGELISAESMAKRADKLGFKIIEKDQVDYLPVQGYGGPPEIMLAPTVTDWGVPSVESPEEYTLSLFEWIKETIYLIGLQTGANVEGLNP